MVLILLSFLIVALGLPFWFSWIGILAGAVGYALFWRAMLAFPERKKRFWVATFWFAAVQAVLLSWMTSTDYMGPLILVVYAFLAFAMGLQFGILSLFFNPDRPLSLSRCLAIAGCWTLLEWSRLFFLTGFPWNPVGFALAHFDSIQFASLFGVYGLSFWVIWVNLAALNAWSLQKTRNWQICWAVCAMLPYLFGFAQKSWTTSPEKRLSIALVQTSLLPEQKEWSFHRKEAFVPPLEQWERVLKSFCGKTGPIDLIVFPEAAFPFSAYRPLYPFEYVRAMWHLYFGQEAPLPPLQEPLAFATPEGEWRVTNAYLAQALSNQFQSHVVIGLDDRELGKSCNAAFHFHPQGNPPERYEKRILMPIVEYLPFSSNSRFSKFVEKQYGINDSFLPGKEVKIFSAMLPIGISICAEETYSHLMREIRGKGAELFVSISNDAWFPGSHLPQHHFLHGRIRAAENGVFLLRSCNTGITGVVDCFGEPLALLEPSEKIPAVLFASAPLRFFPTLYGLWGNGGILTLSFLFFLLFWRKKLP